MRKFVDVSNVNGTVDFAAIKAAGAFGVYLKVSEGTTFVDQRYKERYAQAKAAGLKVGGYHFGHPKNDPAAELAFFLSLLQLEKGDLKPALDLEVTDEQGEVKVHSFAAKFLSGLEAKIGELGVLYAGQYFMEKNVLDVLPSRKWIPDYGARPTLYNWDAWQFSDGLPQYPGAIDHFDTSYVVSPTLLTYQAPVVKRAPAVGKKHAVLSAFVLKDAMVMARNGKLFQWFRRNRFRLIGR